MEELIKQTQWLCQTHGFSGEQAVELLKIDALRKIGNALDIIETDLSELRWSTDSGQEDKEAFNQLMEKIYGKQG